MLLMIGFVRRGGLTGGHDPLDPHALSREQIREKLRVGMTGKAIEEIDHKLYPADRYLTMLSQEAEVNVKRKWRRGLALSQRVGWAKVAPTVRLIRGTRSAVPTFRAVVARRTMRRVQRHATAAFAHPRRIVSKADMIRTLETRDELSRQIDLCEIDEFGCAAVKNRLHHEHAEVIGLIERRLGRHREFLPGAHHIDQNRPFV